MKEIGEIYDKIKFITKCNQDMDEAIVGYYEKGLRILSTDPRGYVSD